VPSNYASIDNKLISAKWHQNQSATTSFLFNAHTDPLKRNEFYGTLYSSSVTVVSKISPSKPKVFNALSYEGNSSSWSIPGSGISTNLNQSAGGLSTWSEKEGSYYAAMPRDASVFSNSNKIYIGDLSHDSGLTYTSNIRLSRIPIPLGIDLTLIVSGSGGAANFPVQVSSVSGNSITFEPLSQEELELINLSSVFVASMNPLTNGDPIRGHFAKITMNNAQATAHELYCINTHITESKANHAKGQ
jgi:hypothetical protein